MANPNLSMIMQQDVQLGVPVAHIAGVYSGTPGSTS